MQLKKVSLITVVAMVAHTAVLADARVLVNESGIWCGKDGANVKGIVCDQIAEMAKRTGTKSPVEILPLARATVELAEGKTIIYGPIVRDAAREKNFQWIAKLSSDELVVVTSTKTKVDASTLDAAKNLSLGVLRGSPAEAIAKAQGFTKVDPANAQDMNAKKLDTGRIEGWISTWSGAAAAAKEAGIDPSTLKRGYALREIAMWVAATPDVPAAEVDKWRAAHDAIGKDGTVAKIYKTYGYVPK